MFGFRAAFHALEREYKRVTEAQEAERQRFAEERASWTEERRELLNRLMQLAGRPQAVVEEPVEDDSPRPYLQPPWVRADAEQYVEDDPAWYQEVNSG